MLKFIHAADFHLDSAFGALPPQQAASRRRESRELALRLANYAGSHGIHLVLLALACAWRENHARYARLLLAWVGIAAGSGVLFAAAEMVSSALEVFFTIAAAQLARSLWIRRLGR